MDNKGNVTVVLHWDQRDKTKKGEAGEPSSWRVEVVTSQPSTDPQTAQFTTSIRSTPSSTYTTAASTTRAKLTLDGLGLDMPRPPRIRTLPAKSSFLSKDEGIVYDDEEEDEEDKAEISPSYEHGHSFCDFHCAALHRRSGQFFVSTFAFVASAARILSQFMHQT